MWTRNITVDINYQAMQQALPLALR